MNNEKTPSIIAKEKGKKKKTETKYEVYEVTNGFNILEEENVSNKEIIFGIKSYWTQFISICIYFIRIHNYLLTLPCSCT